MKRLFQNSNEFKNIDFSIKQNNFPNALLVLSPDSETNKQFVKEIALSFFCNSHNFCSVCEGCIKTEKGTNPDLLIYPKEKTFQVADAKEIVDSAIMAPMIFKNKIYVINDIDISTIAAQNKILKVLEEPPASVKFILTATNETKVLQTIMSRCVKVSLPAIDKQTVKDFVSQAQSDVDFDIAYAFGEGYLGRIQFALENKNFKELNLLADSIINELKSSKQIIEFSSKITKSKGNFEIILNLLQIKFRKMLNLNNVSGYSKICIVSILDEILKVQKEMESNVLQSIQADNLLMKILELKYLYRS